MKPWNRKTAQEYFFSSKFDNVLSTFFVDDLYQILSLGFRTYYDNDTPT